MLHKIIELKPGWYIKVPFFFTRGDLYRSRFDPVTLAIMGTGMALSTYSTLQGGKEAARAGKFQQQQFEAEAQAELMAGGEEALLKRKEGQRLAASQIAAFSASGSGLVGSNLVVMAQSARNVEMDALTIERNAGVQATSLRQQGALARYEGQLARRNARIRAFADLLGSSGQMYGMYKSNSSTAKPATSTGYKGYIGPKKSPTYISH